MFPKLYAAAVVPVAIRTLPLAPFPVVVTVFTEPLVGFATNEPADDFQLAAPLPLCPSALDEYQATSPFRGTLLAAAAHAARSKCDVVMLLYAQVNETRSSLMAHSSCPDPQTPVILLCA